MAGGLLLGLAVLSYETFEPPAAQERLPQLVVGEEGEGDDDVDIFEHYKRRIRKAGQALQLSQVFSLAGLVFLVGGVVTDAGSQVFTRMIAEVKDFPLGAVILTLLLGTVIGYVLLDIRSMNSQLPEDTP